MAPGSKTPEGSIKQNIISFACAARADLENRFPAIPDVPQTNVFNNMPVPLYKGTNKDDTTNESAPAIVALDATAIKLIIKFTKTLVDFLQEREFKSAKKNSKIDDEKFPEIKLLTNGCLIPEHFPILISCPVEADVLRTETSKLGPVESTRILELIWNFVKWLVYIAANEAIIKPISSTAKPYTIGAERVYGAIIGFGFGPEYKESLDEVLEEKNEEAKIRKEKSEETKARKAAEKAAKEASSNSPTPESEGSTDTSVEETKKKKKSTKKVTDSNEE